MLNEIDLNGASQLEKHALTMLQSNINLDFHPLFPLFTLFVIQVITLITITIRLRRVNH